MPYASKIAALEGLARAIVAVNTTPSEATLDALRQARIDAGAWLPPEIQEPQKPKPRGEEEGEAKKEEPDGHDERDGGAEPDEKPDKGEDEGGEDEEGEAGGEGEGAEGVDEGGGGRKGEAPGGEEGEGEDGEGGEPSGPARPGESKEGEAGEGEGEGEVGEDTGGKPVPGGKTLGEGGEAKPSVEISPDEWARRAQEEAERAAERRAIEDAETEVEHETQDAIRRVTPTTSPDFRGEIAVNPWGTAPPLDTGLYNALRRVLASAKVGLAGHMVEGLRRGNVNVRAAMHSEKTGNMRVFEKRIPSKIGAARMAVAIALDASGSMQSNDQDALGQRASIAVLAALIDMGHDASLTAYASGVMPVEDVAKTRGRPVMLPQPGGGTRFDAAAGPMIRHLAGSKAPTKIAIVFTDGDVEQGELDAWYAAQALARLRVPTYFIQLVPLNYAGLLGRIPALSLWDAWLKIRAMQDLPLVFQQIISKMAKTVAAELSRRQAA